MKKITGILYDSETAAWYHLEIIAKIIFEHFSGKKKGGF